MESFSAVSTLGGGEIGAAIEGLKVKQNPEKRSAAAAILVTSVVLRGAKKGINEVAGVVFWLVT